MSSDDAQPDAPPAVLWQGFHHSWTYNHRLNRLGDWIEHVEGEGDQVEASVKHAAASGSGEDDATWKSFYTVLQGQKVHFHPVDPVNVGRIILGGEEEEEQSFAKEVRVKLPPEMEDREVYTVLLNGFDLASEKDADKLASFHLVATPPVWDSARRELVFHVVGGLNVDCDSAECDGYPNLAAYLAMLATGVAAGMNPIASAALALLPSLLGKLNIQTRYRLDVSALVICGDADTLHVTSATYDRSFDWDTKTAIHRAGVGLLPVTVDGDEGSHWMDSALGVAQLSLEVTRERGLFRPDTAMHFLQWETCIVPVRRTRQQYMADLHLFFRNWRQEDSPYMNEFEEAFLTHRDAGSAVVTIGVQLLQFAEAVTVAQGSHGGSIHWAGGNASALGPDAVQSRTIELGAAVDTEPEEPVAEESDAAWLPAVLHPLMSG
jgi:hypothetical protein